MSSSSSSLLSLSSDPGTYISILPNIKRKAINGGARPQAFDNHLHSILLTVNSAQYSRYSEADKAWHIDLFMWEHYFTEPFPFLTDIDLHPNGNTSTTIIRNPCVPRPADIIFSFPPRVPPPDTLARDPKNQSRGVVPEVTVYVSGMVMGGPLPVMARPLLLMSGPLPMTREMRPIMVYPPPIMGPLAQAEVLAWQHGMVGGGYSGMGGEVRRGRDRERDAEQVQLASVNREQSPSSAHRHHRKR